MDGHLKNYMTTSSELAASVVSRIKFIAGLNIAERRIPQDGRITFTGSSRETDLRISVLPCTFGEKIVIRITTALSFNLNKESIGFTPSNADKFNKILAMNHGIVLLTGPTGSGKTTTLYTALAEINREDINIVTVEDPVEMIMPGINQVEINPRTGLTFAAALRSILRQDPNVVMVGEIRDKETADIAMTLSVTGHLVLSTLHTYDAPSAVLRLVDMGVEPFMVSASLAAVVAQRLVRKICPFCKMQYNAVDSEKTLLGLQDEKVLPLYKGSGCERCGGTGYAGRTAVHEIMFMTPSVKEVLAEGKAQEIIKKTAISEGMETISDNLRRMVLEGKTTLPEMFEAYSAD